MALPTAPFDPAKSIIAGLSIVQLKLLPQLTGVTADTSTLTKTGHGLQDGQMVQYVSGTGFTGLVAGTNYFVRDADDDTFSLAATKGGSALTPGTSSAGVFAPVSVFEVDQLDDDPEQEMKYLTRPDAKGRMRNVREVETKANEKFTFNLQEVKRVLEIFAGKMRGRKEGTCTLWIPDPDDDTGTVSLKSQDDFSCVISRDGKITYGSDFSKTTIKIESMEDDDISWTADAAA